MNTSINTPLPDNYFDLTDTDISDISDSETESVHTEREEITVVRKILDKLLVNNEPMIFDKILEYMDIDIMECEICEKSVIYPSNREEDICDKCWESCPCCKKCDNKVVNDEKYECNYCDYVIHHWCKENYEDINFTPNGEVCMVCVEKALDFWDNRERCVD